MVQTLSKNIDGMTSRGPIIYLFFFSRRRRKAKFSIENFPFTCNISQPLVSAFNEGLVPYDIMMLSYWSEVLLLCGASWKLFLTSRRSCYRKHYSFACVLCVSIINVIQKDFVFAVYFQFAALYFLLSPLQHLIFVCDFIGGFIYVFASLIFEFAGPLEPAAKACIYTAFAPFGHCTYYL